MHDPIGLHTFGSFAFVEDKSFLDPDLLGAHVGANGFVGPGGLPITGSGRPVRARAVRVLAVTRAEEIPLPLAE